MSFRAIQTDLDAIADDAALCQAINFGSRAAAVDFLEFNILDRLDGLLATTSQPQALIELQQAAQLLKQQLEAVDEQLFRHVRANVRGGVCVGAALQALFDEYVGPSSTGRKEQVEPGYDTLDLFTNGLLLVHPLPQATQEPEPEMVFYQQTPARIICEFIERAGFTEHDVCYDIGAGLGHVPILVHLLTGAKAKGIEVEPAYCDYARTCAMELNLPRVEFINQDARSADYADGTVFFMYTPCQGSMLHAVLAQLHEVARDRAIKLWTYGPCTPFVAQQPWLRCEDHAANIYKLCVFSSC